MNSHAQPAAQTPEGGAGTNLNEFFLRLEDCLRQVEGARTPTQTLGLDGEADLTDVLMTCQYAMSVLFPPHAIREALPEMLTRRMDLAWARISESLLILGDPVRLRAYEEGVRSGGAKAMQARLATVQVEPVAVPDAVATPEISPVEIIAPLTEPEVAVSPVALPADADVLPVETPGPVPLEIEDIPPAGTRMSESARGIRFPSELPEAEVLEHWNVQAERREPASEEAPRPVPPDSPPLATGMAETPLKTKNAVVNRRREERFWLKLAVKVAGYPRTGGSWIELTDTVDVSRRGAKIRLRQRVWHNSILRLALQMPPRLRSHSFGERDYLMYAVVRNIGPVLNGVRMIGLEFLGGDAPEGFWDKPWALFSTTVWEGANRRREPRYAMEYPVRLEFLDGNLAPVGLESGLTLDISRGGARIRGRAMPPEFDFVRFTCPAENFESLAVIANRFIQEDGAPVLCLQFTQHKFPLDHLAAPAQ
ncbi:MAG: PilZ domain-containing protein [Blastocatellia bacterium]